MVLTSKDLFIIWNFLDSFVRPEMDNNTLPSVKANYEYIIKKIKREMKKWLEHIVNSVD